MVNSNDTRQGVVQSLKSAWASLLVGLHDRADLLSVELQQEKRRLRRDLLTVLAFSFCVFMTFALLNVMLFVLFWDDRLALSLALCAAYAIASLVLGFVIRRRSRLEPPPLDSTIETLRKDHAMLAGP